MPVHFSHQGSPFALDTDQQLLVYRITQEAVNNAIKHAKATVIEVRMNWDGGLHVAVADDGVGFDLEEFGGSTGLGLSNLESRARLLNADLKFLKNQPRGSVVELFLPN